MTMQQLKCLCATVQYGNFSNASDEIFLSQSTVSKNIIALEQIIGFKILERKGRTNILTDGFHHNKIDLKNDPEFHYVLARRMGAPLSPTARTFIRFLCSERK